MSKFTDEAWAEFRIEVKDDIRELFRKVGILEGSDRVREERDRMLSDKMDEVLGFFEKHDEQETEKYNRIANTLKNINKFLYGLAGIGFFIGFLFSIVSFIGFENIKALFH